MPDFGNFGLQFPDGSQFIFHSAYAVQEEVTVVSSTIRVVTRDHGDFRFTLRGRDVVIDGEIHDGPEVIDVHELEQNSKIADAALGVAEELGWGIAALAGVVGLPTHPARDIDALLPHRWTPSQRG